MKFNNQQNSLTNFNEWTNVKLMNILSDNNFPITINFVLCIGKNYDQQLKCKATQINNKIIVNFFLIK